MLIILILGLTACARRTPEVSTQKIERTTATVDWGKVVRVSETNATLQVVVTPLMSRSSPIHEKIFRALQSLHCDLIRYAPVWPYPKLVVPELEPPQNNKTSWDFSLIDPFAEDFVQATQGHSTIWNLSTIPQWMFKTSKPIPYPANPDQISYDYEQGTELRDPSMKEIADYYARLASWYTKGGFTDEYGRKHVSGHHFNINYWEVLNEPDLEHRMTPQFYTRLYDAIVTSIRKVDPKMKFVGMALSSPIKEPAFIEYFLNHKHHKPGIPLDMISYHFYVFPTPHQSPEVEQYTFFDQADEFLDVVRYIQTIRQRLSPQTETTADEIGVILPGDLKQGEPGYVAKSIPDVYWNLCAAVYAYLYGGLSRLGVQGVGESALAQLPGFFPSVTMMDWNTGQPNARYWTLKLLHDNFGPGDKLLETHVGGPNLYAQGFLTPGGKRKLLLVNKRNRELQVSIPGVAEAKEEYVDQSTGFHPPASIELSNGKLTLRGLAVAVVTLP